MRVWFVLVAAVLLAGCAGQAPTTSPAATLRKPTVPEMTSLDLHAVRLNVSVPSGQPTSVVALGVTEDMWVRPFVGAFGGTTPVQAADSWVLCPWVEPVGLPEDVLYKLFPYWLDGDHLTPAIAVQIGPWLRASEGAGCAKWVTRLDGRAEIFADEPRAGTLVVIVATRPEKPLPFDARAMHTPEFHLRIGIARELCPGQEAQTAPETSRLCPPDAEVPALPLQAAGLTTFAMHDTSTGPCDGCGFEVEENLATVPVPPPAGPVYSGTARATSTVPLDGGMILAGAAYTELGRVAVTLGDGAEALHGACGDRNDGLVLILSAHDRPVTVDVTAEVTGLYWGAFLWDIPVHLDQLGWTVEPQVSTWNYAGEACAS